MNFYNSLEETTIETKKVYDGHLLKVNCDKVKLPNGDTSVREYIDHVGATCIVAITDDNKIIVEKQYRYPYHKVITEIPAGKLNSKEEDPLIAAKRELKEETGYEAKSWTPLGTFYPTVAYTSESTNMYLAQNLSRGQQNLDKDEFLNIELIPFDDFVNQILDGKIRDGKTQAAVLIAKEILNKK